ncbi:MAG: GIDE domain-containing protein [Desulfuromonadales bacterium]|nr:GIDE domain-containing protein [Desulfuromonadales bacterium]
MSEEAVPWQLIVRQQPTVDDRLDELLGRLQAEHGLDIYTARQRLLGPGLALLGKGTRPRAEQMATLLRQYGLACWTVAPDRPLSAPDRLRSLEIASDRIHFVCQRGDALMRRGDPVVAVLGDIAGGLRQRYLKRAMAQNSYRGHVSAAAFTHEETLQVIYRGKPVLDLYVGTTEEGPGTAVRVFPGKFNHAALGERAGLSAVQNLDALRRLIEEYAGDYRLYTDFSLGHLPDCPVSDCTATATVRDDAARRDLEAALAGNLASLSRYGQLVTGLVGPGRPVEEPAAPNPVSMGAGLAAAALVGQPAAGATLAGQGAEAIPAVGELAAEIEQALGADEEAPGAAASSQATVRDLPPPPDRPPQTFSLSRALPVVGAFLFGVTVMVGGGDRFFRFLADQWLNSGLLPGLAASGCLWGGFHSLKLKRRIENTPTSRIRSIAMGMVEVHGRARRQYAVVAPMTQAPCVWYRLRRYRKDSRNRWRKIREIDSSHVPFLIDDGTGRVTVAPQRATVRARVRQTGYPGQASLTFSAFNDRLDSDEKWIEDVIPEGTSVYVLGYAQPLRREGLSLRQRTLERLRQLKLDRNLLHRYDADGDGRIDAQEWETARADVERQALQQHLAATGERRRQEDHVLISHAPQRGLPFVVAEASCESELIRKYAWISLPLLLIGLALAIFAIYNLLLFLS